MILTRKVVNMSQQELVDKFRVNVSNMSKMENDRLMPSIDVVQSLMKEFAVSADQLLNEDENTVVDIRNPELYEQLALINQLDKDEKRALIKIINSLLTKKRMKDLLDGKIKLAI